jgi:hypothetical protein
LGWRKKKDRAPEEARSLDSLTARLTLTGEASGRRQLLPRRAVCSKLLRRSLSRSLLLRGLDLTTTAAAAIAAVAAMATAVATAMAAVATAMAAAAVAAAVAAAAAIAAAVMTKGHYLAVAAQQGDSDDREKHRKTKNNNTVHPRILQITYRYRKRKLLVCRQRRSHRNF